MGVTGAGIHLVVRSALQLVNTLDVCIAILRRGEGVSGGEGGGEEVELMLRGGCEMLGIVDVLLM